MPHEFYGEGLRSFYAGAPWVDSPGFNRPGASSWVSDEVTRFVAVLKRQWLLYGLSEVLPFTCWPFIIAEGLFNTWLC